MNLISSARLCALPHALNRDRPPVRQQQLATRAKAHVAAAPMLLASSRLQTGSCLAPIKRAHRSSVSRQTVLIGHFGFAGRLCR